MCRTAHEIRAWPRQQLKSAERGHYREEPHQYVCRSEERRYQVDTFLQATSRWIWMLFFQQYACLVTHEILPMTVVPPCTLVPSATVTFTFDGNMRSVRELNLII